MSVTALIVAAGRGHRAGEPLPKQYISYAGKPILFHTIQRFLRHPLVDTVQVVIHPSDRPLYDEAVAGLDLPAPIEGGDTRQASVLNGLSHLEGTQAPVLILVHDAARLFVDEDVITRVVEALSGADAVVPVVPVSDTVKQVDGDRITATINRTPLRRAQTPQGFDFVKILAAHRSLGHTEMVTDDAAIAEAGGMRVVTVAGDSTNIKITDPQDVAYLRLLERANMEMRTGTGFDVHRVGDGDFVTLCGLKIEHRGSLIGHSDADVALHALTDALLGAVGEGDIGRHFPPSDDQWKDADSSMFVKHAVSLIQARGGSINNVDLTIICEEPKITPHAENMRRNLADLLSIDISRISVKATTTEKLGVTGQGGGIAAQSVATVRVPGQANRGS